MIGRRNAEKREGRRLDPDELERMATVFRAFAEPTRLAILQELRGGGRRSVNELVGALGSFSQAHVSKQLKILYETGLVAREKRANQVFYSVGDPIVFEMCQLVCDTLNRRARAMASVDFGAPDGGGRPFGRVRFLIRAECW
jgi:ArsR family transcriptional regulator